MSSDEIALDILGNCVAGRTLQIARVVSARFDQELSNSGVTAQQLTLLAMVSVMAPVVPRDMLPYLKMGQSTLSRNLDRLAAKGWVEGRADPDDARTHRYSLTGSGKATLANAHDDWKRAQAWAADMLGEKGVEQITGLAHEINPLLPRAPSNS